ncbi:MAG: hypothetical protein QOD07_444 [Frankiaceae bacterium]|jgi:hypothetical protein|nr:hypothetical protein [Frankiaceae bacterium]
MKKVARLLAVSGVSAMTALTLAALPGSAMANQNCNGYGTTSESAGGVTIAVQAGSGSTGLSGDPDVTSVGVCGYQNAVPAAGFTGGTVEAGADTSDGVLIGGVPGINTTPSVGGHTPCGWGGTDPQCVFDEVTGIPGVYVVAQGQDGNTTGGGQLQGYAGLSNYEHPGAHNSTNSGGEIGIEGIAVWNIPSPIVCGDTSGHDWNDTSRQGCEVP